MKTRLRIVGPTLLVGLLAFSGGARGERGAPTPVERDASIHRALGWLGETTPGLADASGTPTREFTRAMTGLVFEMARGRRGSGPHFSPGARFSPDLGAQDLRRSPCADPRGSPCVIDGALSGDASTKTHCSSCGDRTSDATS